MQFTHFDNDEIQKNSCLVAHCHAINAKILCCCAHFWSSHLWRPNQIKTAVFRFCFWQSVHIIFNKRKISRQFCFWSMCQRSGDRSVFLASKKQDKKKIWVIEASPCLRFQSTSLGLLSGSFSFLSAHALTASHTVQGGNRPFWHRFLPIIRLTEHQPVRLTPFDKPDWSWATSCTGWIDF